MKNKTVGKNVEKSIENRKSDRKYMVILIAAVLFLAVLTAVLIAIFAKEKSAYNTVVFKVADEKVRMDEVNFLMLQNAINLNIDEDTLNKSETKLQALGYDSADEYYKNEILTLIMDYKVEYLTAKQQGMTLSDEDKDKVRKDVTDYLSGINARVLNELGLTKERIIEIYEQRYLAGKLADKTKEEIDVDDGDVDKRFATIYVMLFPKVKTTQDGDYVREEDGETPVMLSDEEMEKQKENAYAAYKELTEDGAMVEDVVKKYGIEAFSEEESNLIESFGGPFSKYAKELKEGEYSPVIDESSFYGIVKMVKENNEQISEQILTQYADDVKEDGLKEMLYKWYEELGVSGGPKFVGNSWDKVSFYDFVKYVGDDE